MLILRYPVLRCLILVGLQAHFIKVQLVDEDDICMLHRFQPCCSVPSISLDTITVEFEVLDTGSDKKPYNVTANITWDPPSNDAGYSYSVDISPSFTVEDVENCREKEIMQSMFKCSDRGNPTYCNLQGGRFETVVDKPTVIFGDLLFGFPHTISVQVIANGTSSARTQCTFRARKRRFLTPDCFQSTENLEYCKSQTIPFSSVPRNLTVDVELPPNSKAVILHASWEKPLFVNGYIAYTSLTAYTTEKPSPTCVYYARIKNDTTSTTIVPDNVFNDGFLRGFTYDFVVTPVVILPDECGLLLAQGGHEAVERKYIPDPIITGTMPSRTTATTPSTTPSAPSETEQPFLVYIFITGITVLLVLILCLVVIRFGILRKEKSKEERPVFSIRLSHYSSEVPVLPEFRDKEIINIYGVELSEEAIGSGQFGEVFKATLNLGEGNLNKQTVAVKRSKDNLRAALKEEFLDEIRLMIEIGNHPNIMPLLACRTVAEPYYLITEYMKYGSLKDYLHKSSNPEIVSQDPNYDLTDLRKLQISHQISKGMEYLATTRFFHGDLAARNVLINEEMVAKISDFGLSNDIYAKGYVRLPEEQKRPVKWYSPEANHFGKCSSEGDVWSFGVVLYEIYSGGQEPYPGMLPREVAVRVKAGYRMDRPENCPNQIYIIMRDCWQYEPSDRPSFELIRQKLDEMLSRGDDPYVHSIGDHERVVDNDSSSAGNVERVSVDSSICDASLNITYSRLVPNVEEDPKVSTENNKGQDGK